MSLDLHNSGAQLRRLSHFFSLWIKKLGTPEDFLLKPKEQPNRGGRSLNWSSCLRSMLPNRDSDGMKTIYVNKISNSTLRKPNHKESRRPFYLNFGDQKNINYIIVYNVLLKEQESFWKTNLAKTQKGNFC